MFQDKTGEVTALQKAAEELVKSGDQDAQDAADKAQRLRQQWDLVQAAITNRIKLALSYVDFHKKAQQVGG